MHTLALTGFAFAAAIAALMLALITRRMWLEREETRRKVGEERLRPAVLALVDGDEAAGDGLAGEDAELFAALLGRYAASLRGEARERITRWFEEHGSVTRELEQLRSARAWRRATAAFTLGDMGSAVAVPGLVAALEDRSRDVRSAAVRSLGHLRATEAIEPAIEAAIAGRVPRGVVTAAAIELGPPIVPLLQRLLRHERARVRTAAAELYGVLDGSGDATPLVTLLSDPVPEVRATAALALGRVADASATRTLQEALHDDDSSVRAAAAAALGEIGEVGSLDVLLEVAQRDAFEPARAAARSAARIDPGRVRAAASAPDAGQFLREAADVAAL